jgi:hypothetical protein
VKKIIKRIAIAISITILGIGTIKFAKDKQTTTIEYNSKKDSVAVDGVYVKIDSLKIDSL